MQFVNGDLKFTSELKSKADGVQILQVIDQSNNEIIELGVTVTWEEINGQIIIKNITGLKPSTKYKIRLLVI